MTARVEQPEVIETLAAMKRRGNGAPRAVVMTMGALHEGHAELIRRARDAAGVDGEVLVTVFVNPLQFGPGEDYERYPRTWEQDLALCTELGVDLIFAPAAEDMYSTGRDTRISAGALGEVLEGLSRPGHFDGMLTVVAKLLHLTRADWALFGEKDYQQLVAIRRMVTQLDFPVSIIGVPTVREPDGLALSSRNTYLDPQQRKAACVIPRAIAAAQTEAAAGATPARIREVAEQVLAAEPGVETDYVAVTTPDLQEAPAAGPARILVAAQVGIPRLLDNAAVLLEPR